MEEQIVKPYVGNFIKSLRDIGYNFEIAVADIVDNSITANSTTIEIYTLAKPNVVFSMLDNGIGMTDEELVEAMRLASKDPSKEREKNDLGRFGLGLKTASFSQCKKLTVISKKNGKLSAARWDLNYLEEKNEWLLKRPDLDEITNNGLLDKLKTYENGTLVIWEDIDRYEQDSFSDIIDKLRKHLSLVFHRYLEGSIKGKKLKVIVNNSELIAFNPFNINHPATQELSIEKIKIYDKTINIQPFILPHHSKVSQQEYERYATEEGYTKSQGFYLYRENRLLIYGTWWGLHRIKDAHKLVRIKIDISNDQDLLWGIDIKKSTANPCHEIKGDLKRIIKQITEKGSRLFTGRGKRINDKTTIRFWDLVPSGNNIWFGLNKEHPILQKLISQLDNEQKEMLDIYLKGIQSYLPLDSIQAQLQENPHNVKQEVDIKDEELIKTIHMLRESGIDESYIEDLLKTEMFKNRGELFYAKNE
ncbi:MAG: ATP-binding protein [Paeniclostridium sp.]|nr:ATP-binding protein [Paeniclostridium sp.]MBW4863126.1 ATP-binding protein [Paeniclostridium sp.]MBW4874385.1 ATP-binding protein [Paeniclostridium sp.]